VAKLLIVRHGQTEFNHTNKFVGHTDADMSPEGYHQIARLSKRLEKVKIDAVCSSNLRRAMTTAEIITAGRNLEIRACPELREINYGDAEGLTFDEITHNFPAVGKAMVEQSCLISFPGGECFSDLEIRIRKFISDLDRYAPEQTVLIAGHSGPLTLLVCFLLGAAKESWWHLHMDNAGLSIVNTYPEGAILNLFNDVSHLGENFEQ